MQINISKLMGVVTAVICLSLFLGSGYFLFTIFSGGPKPEVDTSLDTISGEGFSSKTQNIISALKDSSSKINLDRKKDLMFIDGALYKSFTDMPEVIPLSDSRGRPNPFVPYAAP